MVLGSHQPARGGGAGEGAGEERVPLFSRDLEAADSPRESPKAISTKRDGPRSVRVLIVKHPSDCDLAEPESPREHAGDAEWTWRGSLRAALLQLLPCIQWISEYNVKEDLRADLVAGVTVGCMLVPQAMSYAKLAGMPPIYGLYAGFLPVLAYALFGSSRQLAIGPVALVSLLTNDGLSKVVAQREYASPEDAAHAFTRLAILLAFMVGALETLMGLARMGWIVRFLSHSVVSGFTSGAAIIIAVSQVKDFVGFHVDSSGGFLAIVRRLFEGVALEGRLRWPPLLFGLAALALLLAMKEAGKQNRSLQWVRAAGPVTSVIAGTLVVKLFALKDSIKVVGPIPRGLPAFSADFEFDQCLQLLPHAAVITGVGILESVGIAKALAARNGYEIDSNQELVGLGLANIFGSFFSAYPTTGSFSRSAVNNEAGARTGLAGAFVGLIMFVTLLFLTPLFVDIPQCVLGAMIVSAVMGLVDFGEACFLWRVDKKDFLLWMAAFLGTLLAGIEVGVLIAVSMSLAFVIHESANPHMAVLGRLPGTTVYRNIRQYPEARTYRGIVAIRVDAPIYFANISFIKERLRKYELQTHGRPGRSQAGSPVRFVIIEMSPVTYIDSTAAHALKELHDEYRARGIQLALSNPNPKVMTRLAKAGIPDMIGREWYFVRVHDAVQVCISELEGRGEGTTYIKSFHNGVNGGTLGEDLHESGGGRPFKAEWRDPVRSGAAQDRSRAKEDDEQPGGSRGSGHVADLNAVSVNLL